LAYHQANALHIGQALEAGMLEKLEEYPLYRYFLLHRDGEK